MGFDIIAVDKNKTVLELAQQSDETKKTNFICSDLKFVSFDNQSFDAILLLETIGLMSRQDDKNLIQKCHAWLKSSGRIIIDCPEVVEIKNSWNKDFPEGRVYGNSSFDTDTRIQNIQFTFKPNYEEEFGLKDSNNEGNGDKPGIIRYLYPKTEIISLLKNVGFSNVKEIEHYYTQNYYSVLAEK